MILVIIQAGDTAPSHGAASAMRKSVQAQKWQLVQGVEKSVEHAPHADRPPVSIRRIPPTAPLRSDGVRVRIVVAESERVGRFVVFFMPRTLEMASRGVNA